MVRKIKKKSEPKFLDMNTMKDITPVFNYWFNLIGEGEETKSLFDGCRSKSDFLKKFYELILEKHELIDRLDFYRKKVLPFIKGHNEVMVADQDVMDRGKEIEGALHSQTPLGYFETMKMMQVVVVNAYAEAGREFELPKFGKRNSDFYPDLVLPAREPKKKKCKTIWVSNERYVDTINDYEIFTVGHHFEKHPENLKKINKELIDTVMAEATYIKDVLGISPEHNLDRGATRGYAGGYKFSLHWEDKQILIMDKLDA